MFRYNLLSLFSRCTLCLGLFPVNIIVKDGHESFIIKKKI